jgi:hypothetical protein
MHKKVMKEAAQKLVKDAKHYKAQAKNETSEKKKALEKNEAKEALSAARELQTRVKKSHGR